MNADDHIKKWSEGGASILPDFAKPAPNKQWNHGRMGFFDIDPEFMFSGVPAVRAILNAIVPLQVVRCPACPKFHCVAESAHFKLLREGDQIPTYRWVITIDEVLGTASARAEEIAESDD